MKIYADSADSSSVLNVFKIGILSGVTCNPAILAKSSLSQADIPALYKTYSSAGIPKIFFQTLGTTTEQMLESAQSLRNLGAEVVVKVPATEAGFRAAAVLEQQGTPTLVTAVYSFGQFVAACSASISYVAPYFGRLRDQGTDAVALISKMQHHGQDFETELLVASVRSTQDCEILAQIGVDAITAHPRVLVGLFQNETSDIALQEFEDISSNW